tara:strand:- start:186 stop:1211 length:1026 start_codon:yes stop_codon:yes gene_type:complete
MKKIIHIIPSNAIGGVELAAETAKNIKSKNYIFEIIYLSTKKYKIGKSIFSLIELLITTKRILRKDPDFVIVSLWKSCISAYLLSLFKPKVKIILFLHLTKSTNIVDFFLNKIISKKAFQIWSDSDSTNFIRSKELKIDNKKPRKIISFIRFKNLPNNCTKAAPKFIFWGRIHKQKRIDKAIKLIHQIINNGNKNAEFLIIGPNCGELDYLKNLCKKLKIEKNILFENEMDFKNIIKLSKQYSFFLQLSDYEGMAMSVIESMQLGLIPLVTNVGEIQYYCFDKENSIIYKNAKDTAQEVINLISNEKVFNSIRDKALLEWNNKTTYKDDLKENLESISILD